jgi:hypothetical protein
LKLAFAEQGAKRQLSVIFINITSQQKADTSIDGKGTFKRELAKPAGDVPRLAPADLEVQPQQEQMIGTDGSFLNKVKDFITS